MIEQRRSRGRKPPSETSASSPTMESRQRLICRSAGFFRVAEWVLPKLMVTYVARRRALYTLSSTTSVTAVTSHAC